MVKLVLVLNLLWQVYLVRATCNKSKYEEWYNEIYSDYAELSRTRLRIATQAGFWGITSSIQYTDYSPTNGIVMEKATKICREYLKGLKLDVAGRHGSVHDYEIHGTMCSDACVDSDILLIEAMRQSDCTCIELSPSETDPDYYIEGEICRRNSARLLCEELGRCGVWNCVIDDFMCPRHEYNKQHTRFRGLGDCSAASLSSPLARRTLLAFVLISFFSSFFFSSIT